MQRLVPAVRIKAIEIANAMLAEGCEEGQAIRMAIAAAKTWARGACRRLPVAPGAANAPLLHGETRSRARARGA
jgi:hypothetical protein